MRVPVLIVKSVLILNENSANFPTKQFVQLKQMELM